MSMDPVSIDPVSTNPVAANATVEVDLAGRVVLVTGAASGIGAACAIRYAAHGASVIATDVDDAAGERLAAGAGIRYRRLDVADPAQWALLAEELAADPGRLDVVHLNAGIRQGFGDITELDDDAYQRIIGVNQHGVFYGIRATVGLLEQTGGGRILVTASRASLGPLPQDLGYVMSKHAVAGLVRSLAGDLENRGIHINAICPATVDTGFVGGNRARLDAAGIEVMDADEVADGAMTVLGSDLVGQCFVQLAGQAPEPFDFAAVPGRPASRSTRPARE